MNPAQDLTSPDQEQDMMDNTAVQDAVSVPAESYPRQALDELLADPIDDAFDPAAERTLIDQENAAEDDELEPLVGFNGEPFITTLRTDLVTGPGTFDERMVQDAMERGEEAIKREKEEIYLGFLALAAGRDSENFNWDAQATDLGTEKTYRELVKNSIGEDYSSELSHWRFTDTTTGRLFLSRLIQRPSEDELSALVRFAKENDVDIKKTDSFIVNKLKKSFAERRSRVKEIQDVKAEQKEAVLGLVMGELDYNAENMEKAGVMIADRATARALSRVRNVFTTINDFVESSQQHRDYSTDRTVGLEFARDAILDGVTNPDGSINDEAFTLFQLAMMRMMTGQQGDSEFGFGHRFSSATIKMFRNLMDAWQDIRESAATGEDRSLVMRGIAHGTIDADDPLAQELVNQQVQAYNNSRRVAMSHNPFIAWGMPEGNAERILNDVRRNQSAPTEDEALAALGRLRPAIDKEIAWRKVGGFMRQMTNLSEEIPDTAGWMEKAWLKLAEMSPGSLVFMVPGGSAVSLASQYEENVNRNVVEGLSLDAAKARGFEDAAINTLVEKLPGSALGGMAFTRVLSRIGQTGGRAGAVARQVAQWNARGGVARTLATEAAGGFLEESFVEPVAQALLTKGADAALDALGVEHGASRTWEEAFEELSQTWADKSQLAAVMMFSAAVSGIASPQVLAAQKNFEDWMKANLAREDSLLALGLTGQQARDVAAADEEERLPMARGMVEKNMAEDPEGMKKRIAAWGLQVKEKGFSLALAGNDSSQSQQARDALAAAWNQEAARGNVPVVERMADRDGEEWFRVTEKNTDGTVTEKEMNGARADAYLSLRLAETEARQIRNNQTTVYENLAHTSQKIQGAALSRALTEHGQDIGVEALDMNELPEGLGESVRQRGLLTTQGIRQAARTLGGVFKGLEAAWNERLSIARDMGIAKSDVAGTRAFTMSNAQKLVNMDGRTVAGSTLYYSRGNATALDIMEDAVEGQLKMHVAARAQSIVEAMPAMDEAEALEQAYAQLADNVRDFRNEVMRREPGLRIPDVPQDASPMRVIEAVSALGRARLMNSSVLPEWMHEVQDMTNMALAETAEAVRVGDAARSVAWETGSNPLEEIFKNMDVRLETVFSRARMDEEIASTVIQAQAAVEAFLHGAPDYTGAASISTAQVAMDEETRQEEEAAARKEFINAAMDEAPEGEYAAREQETVERVAANMPEARTPSGMKGVFVNDQGVHNDAGGFWMGCVEVEKLELSPDVAQVKAGTTKKNGVINPLTGQFQQDTEAIYVWHRKESGRLEVISGRHKLDLAKRTGAKTAVCYVYNEDATHNARWARLLDFENNMRGDQADELTSAIYTRETGYDDATLAEKGLLRNGSKSKRGILIGREAREDLWTRFKSGSVSAMDAETICRMTQYIADKARVESIQSQCCVLLEQGKGWDYINAMVQLMASKESVFMKQGLLDLGADFQEDMDRMARWVETSMRQVNESIGLIKSGLKLSGKKRKEAVRLGLESATSADAEEKLQALATMKAMLENIGSYPDLVNDARLWDGTTKIDAVGMALDRGRREAEAVRRESGLSREDWEMEQARKAAQQDTSTGTFSFSLVSIPSGEVITTAAEMRARLKPLQGKVFVNKNTGIQAVIEARVSGKTVGKAGAAQMSVANLKALGFSAEDARRVHYTAATRIHELFENAEDALFEESYKDDPSRAGAYHFFNTVDIEGMGGFDVNVTAIKPKNVKQDNILYTLELTIEKPQNRNRSSRTLERGDTNSNSEVSTHNLSSYHSFVNKEKASIKKKAVADGTFMKAPNGKDTNLTEDQWLSVRTAAFKNWFGDWEHDPSNASKVVDENGEPRVVYHGSGAKFNTFSHKFAMKNGAVKGRGFYFTDDQGYAEGFAPKGGHLFEVFLNLRNPFDAEKLSLSKKDVERVIEHLDPDGDLIVSDYASSANGYPGKAWYRKALKETVDAIVDSSVNDADIISELYTIGGQEAALRAVAETLGRDGFMSRGPVNMQIVFSSTQIKSATDNRGTFDSENPDITFSVIGPNAATWEKYADKAFAGRDDGKLRAEIDASQAQLKTAPGMPYLSRLDLLAEDIRYLKNPRKEGVLSDYLDYSELYDAYPRLKKMPVYVFKDRNRQEAGWYDSQDDSIAVNLSSLGPLWNQRSTLLHEIQHAIQEYEGFAEGGDSGFAERVLSYQRNRITGDIIAKTRRRSWLLARDAALDALGRIRRLIRNPKAIKKMSERFAVREVMDVDVMARQAIELLLKEYNKLVAQDAEYGKLTMGKDAEGCELPLCYAGMLLHGGVNVDAVTIEQIDRQIEMVKATVSRKMRFPGEEKRIWQELEKLYRGKEAVVRQLKDLEPFDLYQRLAGEIEARNVEKRRDMTAREREAVPFNDTLEFPGEAIVSFSIASAQERGLFRDGHFEADNAVITEPGVTFSISALHASPHSFRKFSTAFMGKGEGAQAYGWGLYFAENPEVNRDYMNQFAQDKATWKFGDVETSDMEVMHQALADRLLPKDALPEVKEDASDMIWTVLGDLSDARGDEEKIEAIKKELREDIQHSMEYGRTYHQTLEKMVQLHGVYRSLIDLLDEIEVRPGMPSNYRVELNVDDYFDFMEGGELLFWDEGYGSGITSRIGGWLLDEGNDDAYSGFSRNDPENGYWMGGNIYRTLADVLGSPREASEFLLRHGVKGIRYADGLSRHKPEEEQTYNYVIFNEKYIKITAFADESTGGAWADYVDPTASFSLARYSDWARFAIQRRPDEAEAAAVMTRFDEWLDAFDRTTGQDGRAKGTGAARLGALVGLLEAAKTVLPSKYKLGRLNGLMRWAEVYAQMAESGEVPRTGGQLKGPVVEKFLEKMRRTSDKNLQMGVSQEEAQETLAIIGASRMDEAVKKVAAAVRSKLDEFVKDRCEEQICGLAKRAYPDKTAKGARKRGVMDSPHYLAMQTMLAWMDRSADDVNARVQGINAELSQKDLDPNKEEELRDELGMVQTFGDWKDIDSETARKAAENFVRFVTEGRTAWKAVMDGRKARAEFIKSDVRGRMKKPHDANARAEEKRQGEKKQAAKAGIYSLMNMAQLVESQKKLFGSALVHETVGKITSAITNMKLARADMADDASAAVTTATGLKGEHAIVNWLNDFSKVEKHTGVFTREVFRKRVEISRSEAEEWASLSRDERDARRETLRQQEQDEKKKITIPSERDVDEMKTILRDMEARKSTAQKVYTSFVTYGEPVELKASRDAVTNAVLLFEQDDYRHLIANEGIQLKDAAGNDLPMDAEDFDLEQTLKPLYDFIGEDGRKFAYALRDAVNRNGKVMQQAYEARMGVPLLMKKNYWKGNFDMGSIVNQDDSIDQRGKSGLAAPTPDFLIERATKHYQKLDWTNTATSIFIRTMEAQNNYVFMRPVTEQWRVLLQDSSFRLDLEQEAGSPWMTAFRTALDVLDASGQANDNVIKWWRRVFNLAQRALAVSALAGNPFVLVKQMSAVLNGLIGGRVPTKALNATATDFAWKGINIFDWLQGMFNVHLGQGRLSTDDLTSSPYWKARKGSEHKLVDQKLRMRENEKLKLKSGMFHRWSMSLIEEFDLAFNLPGMLALGDRVMAHLESVNREQNLGLTQDQMKAMALDSIGQAMGLASQPQSREEKSIAAAENGLFSSTFLMFSSEMFNKLGASAARWKGGQRTNSLVNYFAFGAMNFAIAAMLDFIRHGDDDEEKRRKRILKGEEDVPESRWTDPRSYAAALWKIATADIGVIPYLGDVQKDVADLIEGNSSSRFTSSSLMDRYIPFSQMWNQGEKLITGRKGRKNKSGERREEMTWHDYVVTTQGFTKNVANATSIFFPGASVSELLLSAAALANWSRGAADVTNRIQDESKDS